MPDATGKLQSSASLTPTVVRRPTSITVEAQTLISDIRARWDDMEARTRTLLFEEYALFVQRQMKQCSGDYEIKNVLAEFAEIVRTNKGKTTAMRKASTDRGSAYFDAIGTVCGDAVSTAMSDLQSMWDVFDSDAFMSQMRTLSYTATLAMKKLWTSDAASLKKKFLAEYKKTDAQLASDVLSGMTSTIETRHAYIAGVSQKAQWDKFIADLKIIWERTVLKARLEAVEEAMEYAQTLRLAKDVYLKSDGTVTSQGVLYPEFTTLRPFDVTHIQAEDAPLFRGYKSKPGLWVRVTPQLSSEGEVVAAGRSLPAERPIESDSRWVAGEDFWTAETGSWAPMRDGFGYRIVAADMLNMPTLFRHTYTSGKEILTRDAFRISGGSKFHCKFGTGLDSLMAFTISMVIMPNPAPEPYPILDYWHGESEPAAGDRFGWWLNDRLDYFYGGMGGSVDQIAAMSKVRPLVITSSVDAGQCTTTVGYSPRHNLATTIRGTTNDLTQWMRFQIGGSYMELTPAQYTDMHLFEVNLWARPLSQNEVVALHSDYYSIYGVADDWR